VKTLVKKIDFLMSIVEVVDACLIFRIKNITAFLLKFNIGKYTVIGVKIYFFVIIYEYILFIYLFLVEVFLIENTRYHC